MFLVYLFRFSGWCALFLRIHSYKCKKISRKTKTSTYKIVNPEIKTLPTFLNEGVFFAMCRFVALNMFVADIEFYIINIFFDVLLFATREDRQNVVGVNYDIISQTIDNGYFIFGN